MRFYTDEMGSLITQHAVGVTDGRVGQYQIWLRFMMLRD